MGRKNFRPHHDSFKKGVTHKCLVVHFSYSSSARDNAIRHSYLERENAKADGRTR